MCISLYCFRFLFNPSSVVAKFYQAQIKSLKYCSDSNTAGKKRRWDVSSSLSLSSSTLMSSSSQSSSSTAPLQDALSEFEKAKALVRAKAAALIGRGGTGALNVMSEEEQKRKKDIEEQRMV